MPGWALRPSSSFRSEHGLFKLVKRILPSGIIIIVLYIYQKTKQIQIYVRRWSKLKMK